jgi:hypothetical protein
MRFESYKFFITNDFNCRIFRTEAIVAVGITKTNVSEWDVNAAKTQSK